MLGRRDVCPRCSKQVYAAEQAFGPERQIYHKACLTCTSCNTRLALGGFQDHEGDPYCRNCHRRLFAPRDLRSATLPTSADNSFSSEPDEDVSRDAEADSPAVLPVSPLSATTSPVGSPMRAGPRRSFGGPRVECPRCEKAVYQAEQVLAVGKKWHRACLQCAHCGKRLDTHNLSDRDGVPYCRSCYAKNYGPAGEGYALLGKAGG